MTQTGGGSRLSQSVSWSNRARIWGSQTDWATESTGVSPMHDAMESQCSTPEQGEGRKKKKEIMPAAMHLVHYYMNGPRLILRHLLKGCLIPDELESLGGCIRCHRHQLAWEEEDGRNKNAVEENQEQDSLFNSLPEDLWLECMARVSRSALQTSMTVCQKWRRSLNSGEFYKVRQNLGTVEDLLFVFGGVGTDLASAVFSRSTGGWKSGFLGKVKALEGRERVVDFNDANRCFLHTQPAVINHKIYILGAMSFPSSSRSEISHHHNNRVRGESNGDGGGRRACTLIYDTWTKTLVRRSPMSVPRKRFATCVIDGRIYVAGGSSGDDTAGEVVLTAEVYIPELDVWKPIRSMPKRRYACIGAAANGIFYVVGGLNCRHFSSKQPQYVCSMDSYDPKTNAWQRTVKLPIVGCVIACTVVGNCIYMLSSMAVELSLWKYDPTWSQDGVGGTFSRIKPPPIPSPLRIDSCLKFSCVTVGKSVYVVQVGGSIDDLLRRSGRRERGLKEGLVIVYDTVMAEWSRGPDMPFVKNGANCAVVMC